jgi:folate-binding protein YgfZ
MAQVTPVQAGYAALLSPQGKILFDFLVTQAPEEDGGGFFLDCPLALAPDLVRRLGLYRLRARVEIEDLSGLLGVAAVVGDAAFDPQDWLAFADPRLPALGWRLIGARDDLQQTGGDPMLYHAWRIGLCVPEGGKDFAYNDAFPHEALMDQLHGVDFRKGCYVGQEVVSRMEHRGTARTRIVCAAYAGGFAPDPGMEVVAGDKALGRTGSQHKGRGLVMLRLDRLAEALGAGQPATAGGLTLTVSRPPFARFDLPGAGV